jgi:hypothetical protein
LPVSSLIVDPLRKFEIQGVAVPVKFAYLAGTIANNQQVIAAVTGKVLHVVGLILTPFSTGNPSFVFKDGSGGATIAGFVLPSNTVSNPFHLPTSDTGYFKTTAGNGLFVDVLTNAAGINVLYIEY